MAALEGTVKVPGAGKVSKKAAAGGIAVVGILIIVYYVRNKSSSSATTATTAAAAATTTDQYPPDGTTGNPSDPYSTDPATNMTYGDEAVGAGTFGAYGSGAASGMYYDPATGAYDLTSPYGTTPPGSTTGGPPFTSNEAWSNWVIPQMVANNPNQDPGALTDALGLYLQGQPVDTSQQQLIFDAQAIAGNPPVAGTNNYPPNVRLNGNKGGNGPGTCPAGYTWSAAQTGAAGEISATGGLGYCELNSTPPAATQVTVPDVTGQRADAARQALRAAGLTYNISDTVTGTVSAQSPKAGAGVASGSAVTLTLSSGTTTPPASTQVLVPNVMDQRAETARPALRAAGLTYNISDTATGTVSAQSPQGGSKVAKGSKVSLTLKGN